LRNITRSPVITMNSDYISCCEYFMINSQVTEDG